MIDNKPEMTTPPLSPSVRFWVDMQRRLRDESYYPESQRRHSNFNIRRQRFRTRWRYVPPEALLSEDYETYVFPELPSDPVPSFDESPT